MDSDEQGTEIGRLMEVVSWQGRKVKQYRDEGASASQGPASPKRALGSP